MNVVCTAQGVTLRVNTYHVSKKVVDNTRIIDQKSMSRIPPVIGLSSIDSILSGVK